MTIKIKNKNKPRKKFEQVKILIRAGKNFNYKA